MQEVIHDIVLLGFLLHLDAHHYHLFATVIVLVPH
jgi:hypothetical protein